MKIEFTTTSLGAPPAQFDLVADGVADMAFSIAGYTPDRIKLTQVAELPFVGDSSEAISVALWRTYEKYFVPADEFKGVKLLGLFTSVPSNLYTVKGPIRTRRRPVRPEASGGRPGSRQDRRRSGRGSGRRAGRQGL